MINIIIYVLLGLHILCSILLTLLVLMQRPKSEGLGTAFGASMTESLFGAGTSDVLTKLTIGLASFFLGVTLLLAILYSHSTASRVHKELTEPTPISAPANPENQEPAQPAEVPAENPAANETAPAKAAETPAQETKTQEAPASPAPAPAQEKKK